MNTSLKCVSKRLVQMPGESNRVWRFIERPEEPQVLSDILEYARDRGALTVIHWGHNFDVRSMLEVPKDMAACFDQPYRWPVKRRKQPKQPLPLERLSRRSATEWELFSETESPDELWDIVYNLYDRFNGLLLEYRQQSIDIPAASETRDRFRDLAGKAVQGNQAHHESKATNLGFSYGQLAVNFGAGEGCVWPDLSRISGAVLNDPRLKEKFIDGFCKSVRDSLSKDCADDSCAEQQLERGERMIRTLAGILEQRKFWLSA